MLLYSAKKNNANADEEYSTLNPATSSASASGISKGALFVSTSIVIIKIINKGRNGTTNGKEACRSQTLIKSAPTIKKKGISNKLKENSYAINCEIARNPPKIAYLDFVAQPAPTIPKIPREATHKNKIIV